MLPTDPAGKVKEVAPAGRSKFKTLAFPAAPAGNVKMKAPSSPWLNKKVIASEFPNDPAGRVKEMTPESPTYPLVRENDVSLVVAPAGS